MKRRYVLIGMLLLLTVISARFLFSGWRNGSDHERPDFAVELDYSFNDVIYDEYDAHGRPFIHLTTPHLSHDPRQALALAHNPRLLLRKTEADWIVTAHRGQLDRSSNGLLLSGEVSIVSERQQPSVRLDTDHLRYDAHGRQVTGEGPVTLHRDQAVITGTGLAGDLDRGHYQILHDVEITIHAAGD